MRTLSLGLLVGAVAGLAGCGTPTPIGTGSSSSSASASGTATGTGSSSTGRSDSSSTGSSSTSSTSSGTSASSSSNGSSGSTGSLACGSNSDCAAPTAVCDTSSHACVECLADADCGSGFSCDTSSDTCWQASCPYTVNTEATSVVASNGCVVRARDTSSCRAAREAQGITGAWLKFSCRVTLTKITVNNQPFVQLSSDNRPDYKSLYYGSGDACYEADNTRSFPDPNNIAAQSIVMAAPLNPTTGNGTRPVPGSGIGMAIDGIELFSDYAAPGDDIYQEAGSFDRCQGHPQNSGVYHHHAEPYSITQDDDALVGVMRDGYFVYGRKDPDGSGPGEQSGGLSAPYYGHVGVTVDSPSTPVFHYHVHYETNGTESEYFITPQTYYGTVVGNCTNGAGGC